jgi:hypothetical protein
MQVPGLTSALVSATRVGGNVVVRNYAAGKAFEQQVFLFLRAAAQYLGRNGLQVQVLQQVRFAGPGGVRVADLVVQIGRQFVIIETKLKIPTSGSALARLIGQLQTFANGTAVGSQAGQLGGATAVEVIVVPAEQAAAAEAAFASALARMGASGGIGTEGAVELLQLVRLLFGI